MIGETFKSGESVKFRGIQNDAGIFVPLMSTIVLAAAHVNGEKTVYAIEHPNGFSDMNVFKNNFGVKLRVPRKYIFVTEENIDKISIIHIVN